jgi:hypothetical protein
VGVIAGLYEFLEVSVLRFDDLVGARTAVREVARATEVLAGHGLHRGTPFSGHTGRSWCVRMVTQPTTKV